MENNPNQYWASEQDPAKLVGGLNRARDNAWGMLEARGLPNLWRLIIRELEGHRGTGSLEKGLTFAGEGDEADELRFRVSLIEPAILQKAQLAQGKNKTKFKCLSVNGDSSTMAKNLLAQKAMDYIFRSVRLDEEGIRGLMMDITYGAAAFWIRWDPTAGEKIDVEKPVIDPATGQPVVLPPQVDPATGMTLKPAQPQTEKVKERSGAPTIQALPPTAVLRDYTVKESLWYMVAEPISKWELMARYPEHADKILNAKDRSVRQDLALSGWNVSSRNEDTVTLNHFYHADTAAVPGGRWVGWVGDTMLWSTPIPTSDQMPVVWLSTRQISGTYLPYPEAASMLAPQLALNEAFTLVTEEMLRHNRSNMAVKKGSIYDTDALSRGGHMIEVDDLKADLPVYITKPSMGDAPKILIDQLPRALQQIAGLNDVSQGNPNSNITSGTFAALMVNTAENNQGLRGDAYVSAQERIGNVTLDLTSMNIPNGFLVDISGTVDSPYLQMIDQDTLRGIHKIQVIRDSKIADTWPARMEMAAQIFQLQNPADRAAAVEMLSTGNMEPITRAYTSVQTLIAQENERIIAGDQAVEPAITDDPKQHVLGHLPTLAAIRMMPKSPEKDAAMRACLMHISKHGAIFKQSGLVDPVMLQIVGLPLPNVAGAQQEADRLDGDGPPTTDAPPVKPQMKQEGEPPLPKPAEPPKQLSDTLQ